jgi:hypothetical protein
MINCLMGQAEGVDPEHFQLIASYSSDPNRYLGNTYPITTRDGGDVHAARVKSYRDVLEEYATHIRSPRAPGLMAKLAIGLRVAFLRGDTYLPRQSIMSARNRISSKRFKRGYGTIWKRCRRSISIRVRMLGLAMCYRFSN